MTFELVDRGDGKKRLRIRDHHGHRIVLQHSLLRPGYLALITPPTQKALFLDREDARAIRDFIDNYLADPPAQED